MLPLHPFARLYRRVHQLSCGAATTADPESAAGPQHELQRVPEQTEPVSNLLLAVVIFLWTFVTYGVPVSTTQIGGVTQNSPAAAAGLPVHSVMNMAHWKYPLSSNDPTVVEKSLAGMRTSLHNAKLWGSDAVLLVPGVVNAETPYQEAWTRSQEQIRKLIPLAEESKITIAIEEVWNKFLLSPLEMKQYIQEFQSPWIKAWFDTGNVLLYGYPQDWIRTLGKRTAELHAALSQRTGSPAFDPEPVEPRDLSALASVSMVTTRPPAAAMRSRRTPTISSCGAVCCSPAGGCSS